MVGDGNEHTHMHIPSFGVFNIFPGKSPEEIEDAEFRKQLDHLEKDKKSAHRIRHNTVLESGALSGNHPDAAGASPVRSTTSPTNAPFQEILNNKYATEIQLRIGRLLNRSTNDKARIQGIHHILQLIWNGGIQAQSFAGKEGILDFLTTILKTHNEADAVKVATLQVLSVIVRNHQDNQRHLISVNFLDLAVEYMMEAVDELRLWMAHTLFFSLVGCADLMEVAAAHPIMEEALLIVTKKDWTGWDYNDAEEVYNMLFLFSGTKDTE